MTPHRSIGLFRIPRAQRFGQIGVEVRRQDAIRSRNHIEPVEHQDLLGFDFVAQRFDIAYSAIRM